MEDNKSMEVFAKAPIRKAALQNALPAMAAMLMVLIYNLADTFFIGQTHDDLQVAAVSLATPVFLLFMSVGTVFGIGGTSVISRALGEGRRDYAKKVCSFCMWSCVAVGVLMSALFLIFMDQILALIGAKRGNLELCENLSDDCKLLRSVCPDCQLLLQCHPCRGTVRQDNDGAAFGKSLECYS